MFSFRFILAWLLLAALAAGLQAQTLRERLIQELPEKLVAEAREKGDVVRGAILFHQGNINCAKCHRATAEAARLGPDLTRMEPDATDAYIVESILQPSKQIKKGFETVFVLTLDGKVISGIIADQNDQHIVIRSRDNVDQLLTINREEIDDLRPGELSNMPEDLADQLKNRQQFLDLLRYVFEIRERGDSSGLASSQNTPKRELAAELNGLVLMQQLNCAACHNSLAKDSPVAPKQAPRLKWSAKNLNPHYLEQFIANPHLVKPGTTMPDVLAQLQPAEREEAAGALVHFLVSQAENRFAVQPVDAAAADRGYGLFHSIGCVACHSPRDRSAVEKPMADSIPLGDLSRKYNAAALVEFLEDPLAMRPSGHMPSMQLTHREAIDLANFLVQPPGDESAASKPDDSPWQVDAELARRGRELFQANRCNRCHDDVLPPQQNAPAAIPIDAANRNAGCLSVESGPWPDWHLTDQQRNQVRAAIEQLPLELTPSQQIDVTLTTFNCSACHSRDQLGGVPDHRNAFFQTTNLNLGDQGRIPPSLTGVGAKLKPGWLRDVLVNHRSVRPYMLTRMPQFGKANIGYLPRLFRQTDALPDIEFAAWPDRKEAKERGLELVGNRGLNCVACHTYKYKTSDTMPAVDLTEMAERLEKKWFYHYMLDPQTFSPNTVMPSFWPGGRPIRADLEGTPHEQIEAIWQYLEDGRQARTPRGVIQEPLIIVVGDEARMLRRKYPGVGKRGIGVGYPGGVNLVYDAEQMRLGGLWQGGFVDAVAVWTGQGSGNVRPLGRVHPFGAGPDLDDRHQPWVVNEGRPPQHRFRGYRLDEKQRPTFVYSLGKVTIEDFFHEQAPADSEARVLKRSVTIASPSDRPGLRFRIASGKQIERLDASTFEIDQGFVVRVPPDASIAIVDEPDGDVAEGQQPGGKRIELQFDCRANEPSHWEWEYVWK